MIGLETLLEADEPVDEEALRLAEERERGPRDGDFERADAIRATSWRERGYEVRDTAEGPGARCRAGDGLILYGRNAVREALRGPARRCVASGREDERLAAAVRDGRRCRSRSSTADGARGAVRLAGPPGRRAPRSSRIPTPTPSALLEPTSSRWSSRSTRSRTRRTSARSAAAPSAPGAAGVVIPERRAAEVTPAVCRASAGAVEHLPVARVRNLADFLARASEAGAWVYGAEAGADAALHRPGLPRPRRAGARRGGEGPAPAGRARPATTSSRFRCTGAIESLNVSAAAAVLSTRRRCESRAAEPAPRALDKSP